MKKRFVTLMLTGIMAGMLCVGCSGKTQETISINTAVTTVSTDSAVSVNTSETDTETSTDTSASDNDAGDVEPGVVDTLEELDDSSVIETDEEDAEDVVEALEADGREGLLTGTQVGYSNNNGYIMVDGKGLTCDFSGLGQPDGLKKNDVPVGFDLPFAWDTFGGYFTYQGYCGSTGGVTGTKVETITLGEGSDSMTIDVHFYSEGDGYIYYAYCKAIDSAFTVTLYDEESLEYCGCSSFDDACDHISDVLFGEDRKGGMVHYFNAN